MRHPTKKFAIPICEHNHELIAFLNKGHLPFDRGEGNYYFTYTINMSGCIGNRRVQRALDMYDNDKYDHNPPFAVVRSA